MRKFTTDQYKQMAQRFNQMSFVDKIKKLQENSDILTLASDGNWWGVKVKDDQVQEHLYNNDQGFIIENEWGSSEMCSLVSLLGIENIDI